MIRRTATICVWSKMLRPDDISSIVGTQPDHKVIMGSERTPPKPRPPAHGWYVASREIGPEMFIEDELADLVARLRPFAANILTLREVDPDVQIQFNVQMASAEPGKFTPTDQNIGFHVKRENLTFITSIGASLDFEAFCSQV